MFAALLMGFVASVLFYLSIILDVAVFTPNGTIFGLSAVVALLLAGLLALGPILLIAVFIIEGILLIKRSGGARAICCHYSSVSI